MESAWISSGTRLSLTDKVRLTLTTVLHCEFPTLGVAGAGISMIDEPPDSNALSSFFLFLRLFVFGVTGNGGFRFALLLLVL